MKKSKQSRRAQPELARAVSPVLRYWNRTLLEPSRNPRPSTPETQRLPTSHDLQLPTSKKPEAFGRIRWHRRGRAKPVRSLTNPWPSSVTLVFPLHREIKRAVGFVSTAVPRCRTNSGCVACVGVSRRKVSLGLIRSARRLRLSYLGLLCYDFHLTQALSVDQISVFMSPLM